MKRAAILAIVLCSLCIGANAQGAVARPPQFVVISFSNCTILDRWVEFRDYVAELEKAGTHVRFTYFVTGANFIPDANRSVYQGPRQKRGYGILEFGGTNAYTAGASAPSRRNEVIASHWPAISLRTLFLSPTNIGISWRMLYQFLSLPLTELILGFSLCQ